MGRTLIFAASLLLSGLAFAAEPTSPSPVATHDENKDEVRTEYRLLLNDNPADTVALVRFQSATRQTVTFSVRKVLQGALELRTVEIPIRLLGAAPKRGTLLLIALRSFETPEAVEEEERMLSSGHCLITYVSLSASDAEMLGALISRT